MKELRNNEGGIKLIVGIIILVAIVFVGISFAKPYITFFTFSSHVHDVLEMEIGAVDTIRTKVLELAEEQDIPIEEADLKVWIEMKIAHVEAEYTEVVDFFGYYQFPIDFHVKEEY